MTERVWSAEERANHQAVDQFAATLLPQLELTVDEHLELMDAVHEYLSEQWRDYGVGMRPHVPFHIQFSVLHTLDDLSKEWWILSGYEWPLDD